MLGMFRCLAKRDWRGVYVYLTRNLAKLYPALLSTTAGNENHDDLHNAIFQFILELDKLAEVAKWNQF